MSEKISYELDYSPSVSNHSTLVYRTVAPQGSSSVTTSITSTVGPTEFIIPPSVFNLSKSRLNFNITAAAGGVGLRTNINGNLLTSISRITLYDSATNSMWCDISNVNQYASLVVPAGTDFVDYSTKSFRTVSFSEVSLADSQGKSHTEEWKAENSIRMKKQWDDGTRKRAQPKKKMTKEELLDQYAIHAMSAQIAKNGINGIYAISTESYRMAELMWEAREQLYKRREEEAERKRRYEGTNLSDLGLPVRYHNCLTCEDIWMKEDLCKWTERDLKRVPNLGAKGLQLVKQAMAEHGLKLKGQE